MKIYPDTKIYILCLPQFTTGGITVIQQLASQLLALGLQASIIYLHVEGFEIQDPVAEQYKKYHADWTDEIYDDPHNILIVYESYPRGIYWLKQIRKVFWWLSVDNYLSSLKGEVDRIDVRTVTRKPLERFYFFDPYTEVTHWCQSEYARQFVLCNGVAPKDVYRVEDYLSWEFLEECSQLDLSAKEDIVAYNPRKGKEITEKLIDQRPDIDWRPIENMTPAEVRELLLKAKVYIDFGHHPGKDRIPREAALSGCVVITGRRGAAANIVDINIPEDFKLADEDTQGILQRIDAVFAAYPQEYQRQEPYRQRIMEDYPRFVRDLQHALEIEDRGIPLWCAVINDEQGQGLDIAKAIWELNEEYVLQFIVDDRLADPSWTADYIYTKHGRRYLRLNEHKTVEILNCADADFLYKEGRIKTFFARDRGQDIRILRQQLPGLKDEDLLLL